MAPLRMENFGPRLKQADAAVLASGYSRTFRKVEIWSIAAFFALQIGLLLRLWRPAWESPWLVLSAVLLAYLAADFTSGFIHWLGDTWGSTSVPVLGQSVIRPFREHHVDQTAITRHDFVETNGANCLISLPAAAVGLLIPVQQGDDLALFATSFLGALIFWVFATNQFHKWAHLERPPAAIAWLQRLHLILPPGHHAIHHAAPFSRYYCITVGWMNWPLTKLRFFPFLESIITGLTGALPRRDDIGERAAILVAESLQPEQSAPEATAYQRRAL